MVHVSHPYMTTGKTVALTIWTFVGKVMSLLSKTLSRFDIAIIPRNKCLLISWLQSLSTLILEPKMLCVYIYIHILFFIVSPIVVYFRVLNIIPCAI